MDREAITMSTAQVQARLHDGTTINIHISGEGHNVLLPVRPGPHDAAQAETMRQWGADLDLGPNLIAGLSGSFRVIAADYEAHRMAHPAPETLTPGNLAADILAIADAADAETFAYYGYSWLGLTGLQLAMRTDRLRALVMGGFPPINGPYDAMLAVTRAAHKASLEPAPEVEEVVPGDWDTAHIQTTEAQTRQFVTMYEALRTFYDTSVLGQLTTPRLAFAGSEDRIVYGPDWGDVTVVIADPLTTHRDVLEKDGWDVRVLPGLDHMSAMHSNVVLPILRDWLGSIGRP
jgi:pimeloyl-ACP methyl ester carboxylesterase